MATLLLRTKGSGDCNTQSDDGGGNAHDGSVCGGALATVCGNVHGLGSGVDDLSGRRGDHVSKLISKTDERRTEGGRRQLVEMDGNNTPGTLYKELDHEARSGQTTLSSRQDPSRDEASGNEGSTDDSATATEPLRGVTKDGTANTCTSLHQDGGTGRTSRAEVLLLLHECCVGVLAGVGIEVEPGHQEDAVDDHAPLSLEHDLSLRPESTAWLLRVQLSLFFRGDELLRLGEGDAYEADNDTESCANPEDRLPGVGAATDTQVGAGSKDISETVTLLKDTYRSQ